MGQKGMKKALVPRETGALIGAGEMDRTPDFLSRPVNLFQHDLEIGFAIINVDD